MRQAGILMPISSLPSSYGVGDFGPEAYAFASYLQEAKCKIWQLLPLNPLGFGNSPYQPYSSIAMDELYISLDILHEQGYIKKPKKFQVNAKRVAYQEVRAYKETYLQEAFRSFQKKQEDQGTNYHEFIQQPWVYQYAVFLTLKKQNDLHCWNEWPLDQQQWIKDRQYDVTPLQDNIAYEMFIQYTLFTQWNDLKVYANDLGIKIMGDIPFYVGIDSLDVWANQSCFLLDDKSRPTFIAGVPPDYFSVTGQRWGNPIYNWDYLKATKYEFWIERLRFNQQMFDIIRIDHFRAFDTYWKIPSSCPTAVEGEWIEAPGHDLFNTLLDQLPDIEIVVEDLGDLRKEVLELRDHFGFPGMKIVQFSFDPKETNNNFEDKKNMVIYSGTHDNQTIRGWYHSQDEEIKRTIRSFFRKQGIACGSTVKNFVWYTLSSVADTAILPLQDIIGLDDAGRMNTPGTVGSPNWEWKLDNWKKLEKNIPFLCNAIEETKR